MKKFLITSLALALVFCACKKTEETSNTSELTSAPDSVFVTDVKTVATENTENPGVSTTVETTDPVVTTAETTEITTVPPETTAEPFIDVPVERITPDEGEGIFIEYEVVLFEDEKINDRVIAEAEKKLNNYDISDAKEFGGTAEYSVEVSSIYKGKGIISTVYTGNYGIYYERSEESGEVLYSINIDTATGRIIYGADIISDFDKLSKAFDNGEFESNYAYTDEDALSNYGPSYGRYPDVSIDANNFYIYIRESDTSDYYITYSIPLEKAKDFLNAKYTNS